MEGGHAKLFVGIDWATQTHQAALIDPSGKLLGERSVRHTATDLSAMCSWIVSFGVTPDEVLVGIEVPHGSVVETLLERGFAVFSINPKQLDRFRDRYSMSGAKDDRRDAYVIGDSLRTDQHCFRRVASLPEVNVVLREWSRISDDLAAERVGLTNQMREQLLRYYPQFLSAVEDPSAAWAIDLWQKLPAPGMATARSKKAIASILTKHRIRRLTADQVLLHLQEPALRVAPGIEKAARAHLEIIIPRLQLVSRQLKDARGQLAGLLDQMAVPDPERSGEQSDVTILLSLPGVGPIVAAALLAEAAGPLAERDYQALRALSGVAPVTRRSGKRKPKVQMRHGCSPRLRNALYHWARVAAQHDPLSKTRYAALRARGHSHGRALRSVADRLLAVFMAMLRSRTLYQPAPTTTS